MCTSPQNPPMSEKFPLSLPRTTQNEEVYANCIRSYLNEIKSLKYQLEQENSRNSELKQALSSQKQAKSDLSSRISALEGANRSLNYQVSELQKCSLELQTVSNELMLAKTENKRIQMENSSLKKQVDDLIRTSNENLESQRKIAAKYSALKNETSELKNVYNQCNQQLQETNNKVLDMQQRYDNLESKNTERKMKLQKLKSDSVENESKKAELQALVDSLKRRIITLENEKREMSEQHSKEVQTLSKSIFAKEEEINDISKSLVKLEEQKQITKEYQQRLSKMQGKCQDLTDALRHSQEQMSSSNAQNDVEKSKLTKAITSLQTKLRDMEMKLEQSESEVSELKQQLSDNRQQFTETLSINHSIHQQQVKYIGEKLEKSQGLCKDLATQLGNSPTKGQINAMKDKIKEMEKSLTSLSSRNGLLVEENEELKRHCFILEEENKKYREESVEMSRRIRKCENKAASMNAINQKYQTNEKKASDLLAQTLDLMERKQKELQSTKRELRALKSSAEYNQAMSKLSASDAQRENEAKIKYLEQENRSLRAQVKEYQEQKTFLDEIKDKLTSFSSDDFDLSD